MLPHFLHYGGQEFSDFSEIRKILKTDWTNYTKSIKTLLTTNLYEFSKKNRIMLLN